MAEPLKTYAGLKYADPAALLAIKNLELRAKIVVQGLWTGLHRSPLHGFSVEFTEYRHYVPGDDLRHMDWRLFGRTDRSYIKKFQDETNLRCFILADLSPSMNFGTRGFSKSEYARTLAATLAYFLHTQGDAVGLMTFDDHLRDYFPAKHRKSHLRQMIMALERESTARSTSIDEPLQRALELVRRKSLFIIISDFLTPAKTLEEKLPLLAAHGHEGVLFHVVDPGEAQLDVSQAALYEDIETKKQIFINPVAARAGYTARMRDHVDRLRKLSGDQGFNFVTAATDHPVQEPLLEYLRARSDPKSKGKGRFTR